MSFRNKTVLVTGGTGSIGNHLVEALVGHGACVSVLQRDPTRKQNCSVAILKQVEITALDLRDRTIESYLSTRRFDFIFHLAGNANNPGSVEAPRLDFEQNVLGTFNLLEALRLYAPTTRLVLASSATVFGEGRAEPFTEVTPTMPIAPYGMSKLAAEGYVALYARLYGLKTVTLRMFSVFGPRIARGVVFDLIRKASMNKDVLSVVGDGSQVRDLSPIANVIDAMMLIALKAPLQGEIYNMAYGRSVTIRELADMVSEAMGIRPRYDFTGRIPAGEAKGWLADISKLTALGYQPKVDLKQGLAETVGWYTSEFGIQARSSIDA